MKLENKPLVEAIFEFQWELQSELGSPLPVDPAYELVVGLLRTKLKERFPKYVRLASGVGLALPHVVQHQLRAGEGIWPVVQIGPGVCTINDTSGYSSDVFISICLDVLEHLREAWREASFAPKFSHVMLRYIDADPLINTETLEFLDLLGVGIKIRPKLLHSLGGAEALTAFQLNLAFESKSPPGKCVLSLNRGTKDNVDAIIWETHIASAGDEAAAFSEAPKKWLDEAHDTAHNVFFAMIDGTLMEKYK
ncbi:TIGR04255 family protein [Achromobacter marplatensis]|uniref:TIGR04255 family protein n=1 Tax=Achromobacter marplatensis TaxID=470868 RepID=UPI0028F1455F|nr:TIGR04255 family protein [Achromobacter marplatensis]